MSHLRVFSWCILASMVLCTLTASVCGAAQEARLKCETFVLPNGLTVLVHEDHKAPVVAIDVTYHVGSMNEPPGKNGFAHLFEHLMFGGSEHLKGSYMDAMERVGATSVNGTTNDDRTNFFETVPVSALDFALFAESDRMGHLNVTQETLDMQRGVVENEKRQRESVPYALADELLVKSTYPAAHPYAHTTIGSFNDLNAASLSDVREWFKTYYGPSNATLTLTGDITLAQTHALVEKYFGAIPPGPPVSHQTTWIAKMSGAHLEVAQDRVPQPELLFVWNVPGYGEEDNDYLGLVGSILSSGTSSRLYRRLAYDSQVATSVSAGVDSGVIGAQFSIAVRTKPNADLNAVRAVVMDEVQKLISVGPTADEMQIAKASYEADDLRGLDMTLMQANTLSEGQVFRGNPEQFQVSLDRVRDATPAELQDSARRWLSDGVYQLTIEPFPDYKASNSDVERTKAPAMGKAVSPELPRLGSLCTAQDFAA